MNRKTHESLEKQTPSANAGHAPSRSSETQYGRPCHSRSHESMDESHDPGHDSSSDPGLNREKEYPEEWVKVAEQ
jgi:hypothetical protein